MKTRFQKAVAELRAAAGARRFVLVVELAHRDAPVTNLQVKVSSNTATWEAMGLIRYADARLGKLYRESDETTDVT